ncbi:MAG: hypothetical protein HKN25_18030 [Pyrinomonadaceae bacterium]|nr:hypothetical protein [Pyrinomonadaceae bacterium]
MPDTAINLSPLVSAHLENIEEHLETKSYIECGHPNWAWMPYLVNRFRGRIRIIHLTRHPVPTSYSWLTHGAFQAPILPHIPPKILLTPFDDGIRFEEYQPNWDKLSAFEKCLFYWSEVNAFACELESGCDIPWLRLRSEDLFEGGGLAQLLDFLDLPENEELAGQRRKVVDKFRYVAVEWADWRIINEHPQTVEIAARLGYDLEDIDDAALRRRYLPSISSKN